MQIVNTHNTQFVFFCVLATMISLLHSLTLYYFLCFYALW